MVKFRILNKSYKHMQKKSTDCSINIKQTGFLGVNNDLCFSFLQYDWQ